VGCASSFFEYQYVNCEKRSWVVVAGEELEVEAEVSSDPRWDCEVGLVGGADADIDLFSSSVQADKIERAEFRLEDASDPLPRLDLEWEEALSVSMEDVDQIRTLTIGAEVSSSASNTATIGENLILTADVATVQYAATFQEVFLAIDSEKNGNPLILDQLGDFGNLQLSGSTDAQITARTRNFQSIDLEVNGAIELSLPSGSYDLDLPSDAGIIGSISCCSGPTVRVQANGGALSLTVTALSGDTGAATGTTPTGGEPTGPGAAPWPD